MSDKQCNVPDEFLIEFDIGFIHRLVLKTAKDQDIVMYDCYHRRAGRWHVACEYTLSSVRDIMAKKGNRIYALITEGERKAHTYNGRHAMRMSSIDFAIEQLHQSLLTISALYDETTVEKLQKVVRDLAEDEDHSLLADAVRYVIHDIAFDQLLKSRLREQAATVAARSDCEEPGGLMAVNPEWLKVLEAESGGAK